MDSDTLGKLQSLTPDKPPKPEMAESVEETDDTKSYHLPSTRIHTLEELIEFFKVDTSVWECEKFVCNKWEMGYATGPADDRQAQVQPLYQVKAWFRRNKASQRMRNLLAEFIELASEHSPSKWPTVNQPHPTSGRMAEISIFDHHFGSHIWGKETGGPDYDLGIAVKTYKEAVSSLVEKVRPYKPERAMLVIGNDQQNSDNRAGTTEKGTQQDNDTRIQKVTRASWQCTTWAIDCLLGEFGAVDVVCSPGNHDPLNAFYLAEYLHAWYRNQSAVKIDRSLAFRKYVEWGKVMLMFTHGNTGKLENYDRTMAAEQPAMWGRSSWREAHTGDKHQRRLIELKGAAVRILPSLRPPDAWTSENHYIGSIRAAEAYIWDKEAGLIGTAVYSIL